MTMMVVLGQKEVIGMMIGKTKYNNNKGGINNWDL